MNLRAPPKCRLSFELSRVYRTDRLHALDSGVVHADCV